MSEKQRCDYSQFILNATKYIKKCEVCNDIFMNEKIEVVKITYYEKETIHNICADCVKKLQLI